MSIRDIVDLDQIRTEEQLRGIVNDDPRFVVGHRVDASLRTLAAVALLLHTDLQRIGDELAGINASVSSLEGRR